MTIRHSIAICANALLLCALSTSAAGQPAPPPAPAPEEVDDTPPADPAADETDERAEPASPIRYPELFTAPTGRLLDAGHIYVRTGLDTGGGASGSVRVGLGDVAEFAFSVTDVIRARRGPDGDPERIYPYATATFKMGISEHRLFRGQPALALGFRKSFEREADDRKTRLAELYLVASKQLSSSFALHLGGVFWDASIAPADESAQVFLHDKKLIKQLRVFGGVEIEPLPDSKILLELLWVPEFEYGTPDRITLTPMFSWGVRYTLADWVDIESGVRLPDIAEANLINAQIFGQLKFVNRRLKRAYRGLK